VLHNDDLTKEDDTGGACSMQKKAKNACEVLVGKPEGKRSFGR
jgi:hypothetical protein